jgi:hypothetical protein
MTSDGAPRPRAAALSLPVPQNRIFRLSGGRIAAIAAGPAASL